MRLLLFAIIFLGLEKITFSQDGFVQYRYESGIVSSEGTMRQGKPDGYWKTYYPDGSLKTEGNRRNFQLDSIWIFYRSNKTIERMITYVAGIKQGPESTFDEDGNRMEDCLLENGLRNGQAKRYYPNGALKQILIYENNKEEGRSTEYDTDGRIITQYVYRNGFVYSEERINRYDAAGKRTGVWRDLFA
ncbi:MAG: toxin-antitoxin system YwqK family antitoxin, partial [Flavobacteriales bacterium]